MTIRRKIDFSNSSPSSSPVKDPFKTMPPVNDNKVPRPLYIKVLVWGTLTLTFLMGLLYFLD